MLFQRFRWANPLPTLNPGIFDEGSLTHGLGKGLGNWSRVRLSVSLASRYRVGPVKKSASGVPCLRQSGFAQAGRACVVLTYSVYAPGVKVHAVLPEERCVLAQTDWADETAGLLEQAPCL